MPKYLDGNGLSHVWERIKLLFVAKSDMPSIVKGSDENGLAVNIGMTDTNTASGNYSMAAGRENEATANGTVAMGRKNKATGNYAVAVGYGNTSSGGGTHAEGGQTEASGVYAHSEGYMTKATAQAAHAEGNRTVASGNQSHAEGAFSEAQSPQAHAEGYKTVASGNTSHAEGSDTVASGVASHAEGYETVASHRSQHVFGEYNENDPSVAESTAKGNYIEIVGNGTADNARSNARTLDWSGNEVLSGKLTMGTAPSGSMDAATKGYVDTEISSLDAEDVGLTVITALEIAAILQS